MLTIEQCYKIDPALKKLPLEKLLRLRDELYQLAHLALERWEKDGSKNQEWSLHHNTGKPKIE